MPGSVSWTVVFLFSYISSLFVPPTLADFNNSSPDHQYYPTHDLWTSKPLTPQFRSWYPNGGPQLEVISSTTCNQTLSDYNEIYSAPRGSLEASYLLAVCYRHESCILSNMPANRIANFNAAYVILGLLPTLLATMGPSVAEISLLSTRRPLLSFLISIGAPAIWPTRLFEYKDPLSVLEPRQNKLPIPKLPVWGAVLVSFGEYIVILGAAANIIHTSVQIGQKTILAWSCTFTWTPLLWTTLSCVVHLVAASSYQYQFLKLRHEKHPKEDLTGNTAPTNQPYPLLGAITRALKAEFTICANKRKLPSGKDSVHVPKITILLSTIAGIMGFIHITFGTIVFSSLQFVSVWDVLNRILVRYLASTFMSRIVLLFELGGLREPEE